MKNWQIFSFSILFPILFFNSASHAETLPEYIESCESELQISPGEITGFSCKSGAVIPGIRDNCEKFSFLHEPCPETAYLGKLEISNPDASVVWICRESRDSLTLAGFYDVAMIATNRKNGKTCFIQSKLGGLNFWVPETLPNPRTDSNQSVWLSPASTANQNCTKCHKNDAYVVSDYLAEAFAEIGMMHFIDPKGPYDVVGEDFQNMRDLIDRVNAVSGCADSCHYLPSGDLKQEPNISIMSDAINKRWMPPSIRSAYHKYEREVDEPFVVATTADQAQFKNFSSEARDWIIIDDNNFDGTNTFTLAAGKTKLFKAEVNGNIWRHFGKTACSKYGCYGWQKIGGNTGSSIVSMDANDNHVVTAHFDSSLWRSNGETVCKNGICPNWTKVDTNVNFVVPENIQVAGNYIYQLNSWNTSRGFARHNGSSSCNGNNCGGWQKLDNADSVVSFTADGNNLYAVRRVMSPRFNEFRLGVWRFTGAVCNGNSCNGWQIIDNNQNVIEIAAGGNSLYQRRSDNTIWRFNGQACNAQSCPGWQKIDQGAGVTKIAASGNNQLYKFRADQLLWRYTGGTCSGSNCNANWKIMDASGSIQELITKRE